MESHALKNYCYSTSNCNLGIQGQKNDNKKKPLRVISHKQVKCSPAVSLESIFYVFFWQDDNTYNDNTYSTEYGWHYL